MQHQPVLRRADPATGPAFLMQQAVSERLGDGVILVEAAPMNLQV
jgi:hypothetical protein